MKIRTANDIEQLDQKIKSELGIDVRNYRDDEVVANFVDLLVFPEYVFTWVVGPILGFLGLYLIGFWYIDLVHIEYVLYALIGFVLFIGTGFILGLLVLTYQMKNDLKKILTYTFTIMKQSLSDTKQVNSQIKPENRKDVLSLLFKGILHIVTLPTIRTVLTTKFFFLGGILSKFVSKILTLVSDRITFDPIQKVEGTDGETVELESDVKSIASNISLINKIIGITFGIAQVPLLIASAIFSFLLIGFLYLIG